MRLNFAVLGRLALATSVLAGAGCTAFTAAAAAISAEPGQLHVTGLRTRPGSMMLPYVHYHQPGRQRRTVFFLTGGPGVSNAKHTPPASWLDDFDVVVLEYRGVGSASVVLDSPHFARGLLNYGKGTPAQQATALGAAYRAGFAHLAAQGVAFDEFSVDALADDIEQLRKQLNLEQIYLVGHSFGTRVALSYQSRYRARAAGAILFALNTPGGFIWHPEQTQRVWSRYRDALATSRPQQAEVLDRLLRGRTERVARYGLLPLNNQKAMMVAFFLSFNRGSRDAVLNAMDPGRASATWYLYSLGYDMFIRFGFNWADFYVKAYTADCDRAVIAGLARAGEQALFQSPSAPLFGGADGFEAAGGRCAGSALAPDYRNTLAINGEFDPSTPLERRPSGLPDERFVVIPGAGHADIFYADQDATVNWLRRFFQHPDQARPPQRHPVSSPATSSRKE